MTAVYRLVVADRYGFAMPPADAVEHLEQHVADGDDEACDECPDSLSIRTGSALPSEPDEHGLNSRLPVSWTSSDLLMEQDGLSMETWADMLDVLRGAVAVDQALTAGTEGSS